MTLLSTDKTVAVFNSIPGQGVIYSVIVRDPLLNTSASYVPVHTYACSFNSTLDGCQTLGEAVCTDSAGLTPFIEPNPLCIGSFIYYILYVQILLQEFMFLCQNFPIFF